MRIGFDAKRIFHNFRGIGNYSRSLVEGLQQFYPEHDYFLYSTPLKDPRGEIWKEKMKDTNLRIPHSGIGKSFPSLWRSLLLSGELKKDSLDIYHGLSHEIPPGIDKLNLKSVVTIHDLIYLRHPEFFPWIDRKVYDRKFRFSCEKADLVVAICEQTKRDLIEFFKVPEDKIRVVYQTYMPHFEEAIEKEKRENIIRSHHIEGEFILYTGAIEERKNALTLVKAFNQIKDDCDESLVIIGKGKAYKDKILSYVKEHKLEKRVHVLTNIPWDMGPVFFQSAKVFVYPSFFEGFGIPIVEALVSGTPVITSKGSCFPEAGGEHSIYIDPHNVEELAFSLKGLLEDSERRERMIIEGKNYVQKFRQENTTQNIMKVYRELL